MPPWTQHTHLLISIVVPWLSQPGPSYSLENGFLFLFLLLFFSSSVYNDLAAWAHLYDLAPSFLSALPPSEFFPFLFGVLMYQVSGASTPDFGCWQGLDPWVLCWTLCWVFYLPYVPSWVGRVRLRAMCFGCAHSVDWGNVCWKALPYSATSRHQEAGLDQSLAHCAEVSLKSFFCFIICFWDLVLHVCRHVCLCLCMYVCTWLWKSE